MSRMSDEYTRRLNEAIEGFQTLAQLHEQDGGQPASNRELAQWGLNHGLLTGGEYAFLLEFAI